MITEWYYSYRDYARNHMPLDIWSVRNKLDFIENFAAQSSSTQGQYYSYFNEETNTLANYAADLWNELHALLYHLSYALPQKSPRFYIEDEDERSGIVWFDSVACLRRHCDVVMMMLNEERIHDIDDVEGKVWFYVEQFQDRRRKALMTLPKLRLQTLMFGVTGFLTRYMELLSAFHTIQGVIDILDEQHALLVTDDGDLIFHGSAQV